MRLEELARELHTLNANIRHDLDHVGEKVEQVNDLIEELGGTGLLCDSVVLGSGRQLGDGELGGDACTVMQAMLLVPEGAGICRWKGEDSIPPHGEASVQEVRDRFVPFSQCNPAEKAFLLQFIEELLDELTDIALVAASRSEGGKAVSATEYFAARTQSS